MRTGLARSNDIVEYLKDPCSYPDRPASVEVAETHASWVFLTDHHAFKLKKPVRFEFLDFSTAERRHRTCLDEVRLNRRLAPDVYLDVLPITRTPNGSLELNGRGQPIDWVVQMRRLAASRALDVLMRENRLKEQDVSLIAKYLASFYAGLPASSMGPEQYRQLLESHAQANGKTLLDSLQEERPRVRRVHSAQLRYIQIQEELLSARVTAGRVVEGHGDLRPEHIYLNGNPRIIDCIEFSEELRTVDIADELCFLLMECERLGDAHVGASVLFEYQRVCKDEVPPALIAFYCSYRALVRAKVALLRGQQGTAQASGPSLDLIHQYIELADGYAAKLGSPVLLLVGGLMGTGKSTLANALSQSLGIELLSTDRCRRSMFGPSSVPANYGEGHYRDEERIRVYDELLRQADEFLQRRESVILDGTFLTEDLRRRAFSIGDRHRAASLHVQCTCPSQTARARIQRRAATNQSESEARAELYELQARNYQPPSASDPSITIDTTRPISQQLNPVYGQLRRMLFHHDGHQRGPQERE